MVECLIGKTEKCKPHANWNKTMNPYEASHAPEIVKCARIHPKERCMFENATMYIWHMCVTWTHLYVICISFKPYYPIFRIGISKWDVTNYRWKLREESKANQTKAQCMNACLSIQTYTDSRTASANDRTKRACAQVSVSVRAYTRNFIFTINQQCVAKVLRVTMRNDFKINQRGSLTPRTRSNERVQTKMIMLLERKTMSFWTHNVDINVVFVRDISRFWLLLVWLSFFWFVSFFHR